MGVATVSIAKLVRKDVRVVEALRGAMKAGRPNKVLVKKTQAVGKSTDKTEFIENIEDFAPAEVKVAYERLILTIVHVTRELEGE